jgi:hypothetical protein
VSVYLALHTSAAPSIGDIAEFGRLALLLGATPDQQLAASFRDTPIGQLTVVVPIPEEKP